MTLYCCGKTYGCSGQDTDLKSLNAAAGYPSEHARTSNLTPRPVQPQDLVKQKQQAVT